MQEEIKKLFQTRDKAVKIKDKNLLLSTQPGEIEGNLSSGYFELENLKSEVFNIYTENDLQKIVFVKETYSYKEKDTTSVFLIYFLVNIIKSWKIYKIR